MLEKLFYKAPAYPMISCPIEGQFFLSLFDLVVNRAFRAVRLSDVVALVVKALAYITEKSQLNRVVVKEDYEDAARIKVAIAASTTNDTVCRVMAQLNKAIKEERYKDASFIRDYASAGLLACFNADESSKRKRCF
ncbi:hypothetical protein Tco_1112734 [Tanacetum coccineum]|uniref:Uncharacterized protein n=1 Tax=Tanacetum coccineum TaxID=301880 RepID=A0ABQ5IQ67_9ASTR